MNWFYNLNKIVRSLFCIIPAIAASICFYFDQLIVGGVLLLIAIVFLALAFIAEKKDKEKAASEEQAKHVEAEKAKQQEDEPVKTEQSKLNSNISDNEKEISGAVPIPTESNKSIDTVTVIDFETANHSFTSACSIGIAVIKGNEIIDKLYYLIQPPRNYYTNDNIAIHHITPADTANADTFPAVWEKIKHLFKNTYLAAHNASFDMSVLKATLNHYNLPQPHFEYVNTIAVSSYSIPAGANVRKSLDARCEYFGITLDNHHNALADAEAAAQLIICNVAKSRFKSAASFLRSNSSYLKNYDDVKLQAVTEFKHFNKVNVNEIAASTAVNEETDADFEGKTFVITGEFKTMTREQALAIVVERGGIIKSGVSSKVDILVNADNRTSTKTKAAEALQAEGHHIKIINEEQFMRMLESNDAIDLD
ncbi:MAG: 3'-5' exoribonuclease [Clostridia bacterium]|nr:3'-5' exoribonuclease [Clostridia bacterium]